MSKANEKSYLDSDPEDLTDDIDFDNLEDLKPDSLIDDVEIENVNLKTTFIIDGNFVKIFKQLPEIIKKKHLHPVAHILLKKKGKDEIRLYVNFHKDKRKKITQIQKYFKDLKVRELSNEEPMVKKFPQYANKMKEDKLTYKHFSKDPFAELYTYLKKKVESMKPDSSKNLDSTMTDEKILCENPDE